MCFCVGESKSKWCTNKLLVSLPGGPPKFVAPNGVPVTKIYRGGKFMVQGPGPEPFTMEGMYQDTQTYEAWVNSLVT